MYEDVKIERLRNVINSISLITVQLSMKDN